MIYTSLSFISDMKLHLCMYWSYCLHDFFFFDFPGILRDLYIYLYIIVCTVIICFDCIIFHFLNLLLLLLHFVTGLLCKTVLN